jgi:hypothetical protein
MLCEFAPKNQPKEVSLAFGNTLGCWDKPRALWTTRLTTARIQGEANTFPHIVFSAGQLAARRWELSVWTHIRENHDPIVRMLLFLVNS